MAASRLESRIREVLGRNTSPEEMSFAVDFLRLAVRALNRPDPGPAERQALTGAVRARTGIALESIQLLLDVLLTPALRAEVTEAEVRVFEARFGASAAEVIREDERSALALDGFALRYGPPDALLLLDALFAASAAEDGISTEQQTRLGKVARELAVDPTLVSALLQKHDRRHASGELRFHLRGTRMVIGRGPGCDVVLPDPLVALRHAELLRVGNRWRIADLKSGRPTVVNSAAVAAAPLASDDRVRIGPYTLRLSGETLKVQGHRNFSALSVRHLNRSIGALDLLSDVSFTVFSGEVIALVGPSGSGKTTLLNAISGITPPDEGDVLLDGENFHPLVAEDPQLVGMVPQDDLVHADLTVEESLGYAARLRLPDGTSDAELQAEVDRVLSELDIDHIRGSRIGDALRRGISGGQRKRVNLGQDLVSRSTRLLFLDEPTSGLDPRAAQDIVRLVRQLADRGRIVFMVTHDLSPQVMTQVDHLLVLAPGGHIAWFGPPADACAWFGVATPDALFDRMSDLEPAEWGARWRGSSEARKYVATREHLLGMGTLRKGEADAETPRGAPSTRRQLRPLTERYLKVKLRDRTGLAVLALQAPLLALVQGVVFPGPTPPFAFTLVLSALWFGMSGAVRELISDRAIWRRERRVGVAVGPYLGSKLIVLAAISAIQCAALGGMVYAALSLGDYEFSLPGLMGVCVLTGWVGLSLGLLISSVFRSSEAAVGTLPLLLIPQIAFSGLIVALRDMPPLAHALTWATLQRYAFEAALKCGGYLAVPTRVAGELDRRAITGPLYELGLKPAGAEDMGLSMFSLCGAMVAFSLLFLLCTWGVVRRRDEG